MIGFIKRVSHFLIGFLSGLNAEKPAALTATIAFVSYQAIEQNAIHDKGYPEIREWSVGFALGLVARWLFRKPVKPLRLRRKPGRPFGA